ncbi:MAG TPA: hypothetical protein VLM44_04185 [Lutibacter sp.]|nr:hypothetical protein [Lutibacter sp.]
MFEENSYDRLKKMPIFKKAQEIMEISLKISESVSKHDIENLDDAEGEMLEGYAQFIRENAIIIPAKISGAEAVEIYDLKMENATIIRKAARELSTFCTGLAMCGYKNTDYLQLLRDEIEEFRVLFAEWVKTFDQWNYLIDRWGLFNPPGIDYDTHDPDDDIPFDSDEL